VRNGHRWFELVEPTDDGRRPEAAVQAVIWARTWQRLQVGLRRHPAFSLRDGIEVRIAAAVDLRTDRASIRLDVTAIDPAHTLGALAGRRDAVLRALAAEDLLGANGALPFPLVPLHVGLVTSAGSAACEDFLHQLAASGVGFRVSLVDVTVQGTTAERSVVRGLRRVAAGVVPPPGGPDPPVARVPDVVALVRGGGSRADLAAFDGEAVARAIAACPVPVVTGIGHEIDTSVADAVAARACKTPTACAAELVADVHAYLARVRVAADGVAVASRRRADVELRHLEALAAHARRATGAGLDLAAARVDGAHGRLAREATRAPTRATEALTRRAAALRADTRHRLATVGAELDARAARVPRGATAALGRAAARTERATGALGAAAGRALPAAGLRLDAAEERVRLLDPATILARGYSLTRSAAGRLVRHPDDVAPGDELRTTVAGGDLRSVVAPAPEQPAHPTQPTHPTER
jgi:exodeoxyribonuclease VII large subunit